MKDFESVYCVYGILDSRSLDPDIFAGCLDAFTCGVPPHDEFAIGLAQWVAALVEIPNDQEAALFPRDRQWLLQ